MASVAVLVDCAFEWIQLLDIGHLFFFDCHHMLMFGLFFWGWHSDVCCMPIGCYIIDICLSNNVSRVILFSSPCFVVLHDHFLINIEFVVVVCVHNLFGLCYLFVLLFVRFEGFRILVCIWGVCVVLGSGAGFRDHLGSADVHFHDQVWSGFVVGCLSWWALCSSHSWVMCLALQSGAHGNCSVLRVQKNALKTELWSL